MGVGEDFLIYLNDDNRKVFAYVEILEINEGFVKFKTEGNILIIPISRVIKIKQKGDYNGD
jgi:hypothetical protein